MEKYKFTNLNYARFKKFKEENELEYDDERHVYFCNGRKIDYVTKILQDAEITSDYSKVNSEVLERATLRGTAIHLQVEDALKNNNYDELEEEAEKIVGYIKEEAKKGCILIEESVLSLNEIKPYAGRFDILIENKKGEVVLYDIKTYKVWSSQKSYQVSWQLSLYAKALGESLGKIDKLAVLRFDEKKGFLAEEVKKIEDEEINDLLKNGKLQTAIVPLQKGEVETLVNILKKEKELKELEEKFKDVRKRITQFMEENQILKARTLDGSLSITFVPSAIVESLNTEKLKKERPEIFREYKTKKTRNSYIRILTNKKEKEIL